MIETHFYTGCQLFEVNTLFSLQKLFQIHKQPDAFHLFILNVGDLQELVLSHCV